MPDNEIGSAVARLLLGNHLKQLRERKGIHSEDAAAEVGVARATLWRMESGDNRCRYKPGDVELLARFYEADKDVIDNLIQLSRNTRKRSWAAAYRDILSNNVETHIDLEAYAARIRCYASSLVPDLLQDADYARALFGSSRWLTALGVRQHTQIRLHRQDILDRVPQAASFEFLIDEAALCRMILRPEGMTAQLTTISGRAAQPAVSVRVVPYRTGMHRGLETGPFDILEFPKDPQFGGLPTTATHLDLSGHQVTVDKPTDIDQYEEWWHDIAAHALDEKASRQLITDLARHPAED